MINQSPWASAGVSFRCWRKFLVRFSLAGSWIDHALFGARPARRLETVGCTTEHRCGKLKSHRMLLGSFYIFLDFSPRHSWTINTFASIFMFLGMIFDVGVWYYVKDLQVFDDEKIVDTRSSNKIIDESHDSTATK